MQCKETDSPKKPPTRRKTDTPRPTTSEEQGVRVEEEVRVHDEETLGETQTRTGVWVSPAPESEKKERQTSSATTPNKQRKTNRTNNPKALNKKPITGQTKSRRNYHSRVAGPMGRPALSEETPRGTVVPRGPRTPGTAPGGARTSIVSKKILLPQKVGPDSWPVRLG